MKSFRSSSTLQSSQSFAGSETSSGPAQVIYIAADKDFKKPAIGQCVAEVLQGKISRKVGHSKVFSLSAALAEEGITFQPSPSLHMLFHKHPYRDHTYIGIKQFHSIILEEKKYAIQIYIYHS